MSRRGDMIIACIIALSLVFFGVGIAACIATMNPAIGAMGAAQGCFLMLCAVFLEVYSRRG